MEKKQREKYILNNLDNEEVSCLTTNSNYCDGEVAVVVVGGGEREVKCAKYVTNLHPFIVCLVSGDC